MTPEGAVKRDVKRRLAHYNVHPFVDVATGKVKGPVAGTYYMPVAGPFAVHGIHDFVGCWAGHFFSLETKAPDATEDATVHQQRFHEAFSSAGGYSFVGVRDAMVVDVLARKIGGQDELV